MNACDQYRFLFILSFVFLIKKLQSIWFTFPLMNILNIYRLDFVVQGPIWYLLSDQIGGILSVTHI